MRALGQWVVLMLLGAAIGYSMVKENPQGGQHHLSVEHSYVGSAIAKGAGFADPFGAGTGPTAWFAPASPAVVGAVYKQAPPNTEKSNYALLGIKALALTLAAGLFWGAARRWQANGTLFFVILFAAGLFTNYTWLTQQFSDQWLTIFWSGFLLFGMANLSAGRGKFLFLLAALGAPLVSPALTVGLLVTLFWKGVLEKRAAFLMLIVSLVGAGLWVGRNHSALGIPYPVISNFGYTLYQSQELDRDGVLTTAVIEQNHPRMESSELHREYQQWGEKEFGATYRVKALESIKKDSAGYQARVVARAKNAFFFLETPHDLVATALTGEDVSMLRDARILTKGQPSYWAVLDWSESDITEATGLLPLSDKEAVLAEWREAVSNVKAMREPPEYKARGFGFALFPILAMFIGVLRGGLGKPGFRDPAFLYLFYLLPYVLVEHYAPHQLAAVGLQAWLVYISLFSGYLSKSKAESEDEEEAAPTTSKSKKRSKSSGKGGTFKPEEGSTVELEIQTEEGDYRCYFVQINSVSKSELNLPRPGNVLNRVELTPGDEITLSYFDEAKNTHFSYRPEVIEVMEKEFTVTAPKPKQATAVPIAPRDDDFSVEAEFSVMYSAHRSTHRQVATTKAVTPNSLFLRTNLAVPPQTTLRMKLELPLRVEVDVEGKALYSEADPDDKRKHVCEVPFDTIDPEGREKMLMFAVYYQQQIERARAR